jgi:hypothetical protein
MHAALADRTSSPRIEIDDALDVLTGKDVNGTGPDR